MTAGTPVSNGEGGTNRYTVRVSQRNSGWDVQIVRPDGVAAFTRPCSDETEARTFASTVQQHISWLSPAKFADYYRLQEAEA